MAKKDVLFVGEADDHEMLNTIFELELPYAILGFADMQTTALPAVLDRIALEPINALITGWKVRGGGIFDADGLVYGPKVAQAGVDQHLPTLIYTAYPDALPVPGSILVRKDKIEFPDLVDTLAILLAPRD